MRRQVLAEGIEILLDYDKHGNLIESREGERVLRFEYDKLDRLTAVVTPSGQRLEYTYAVGEPSLITQMDHYTGGTASLRRDTGWTFSSYEELFASRSEGSRFGSVRFDDKLGRFQLSGASGYEIATRADEVDGPLSRLRLVPADGAPLHERQRAFQAPSNLMYLPAEYAAVNCCPDCPPFSPEEPMCDGCYQEPPPPTVDIAPIFPNPILLGSTASTTVTVNPPSTVFLQITSNGAGRATFRSTGSTSMPISETTTVTIVGDAASSGGGFDLRVSAIQGASTLAATDFTVTSGACTASYFGHTGGGNKNCPSQVQLRDRYTITNYYDQCQFTCFVLQHDNTFTPGSCTQINSGILGSTNRVLELTLDGSFHATDCSVHSVRIRTRITNAAGFPTDYQGSGIPLKCNALPNGSACPP